MKSILVRLPDATVGPVFKIIQNLKNLTVGWTDLPGPLLKMDRQIERESGRKNAMKGRRATKG